MVDFHHIVYLKTTKSTNDYAITLSNNDPNHNTCTYSFDQIAGRGQIGRYWFSDTDKNLTTTFSWKQPDIPIQEQFRINMAFSLALWDFAASIIPDKEHLMIKWPNDIYFKDKKLAGILIQNVLKGTAIEVCHLGVGINVNQLVFPESLPNPISFRQICAHNFDLEDLQKKLIQKVSSGLGRLSDHNFELKSAYESLLFRKEMVATYQVGDQKLAGIIKGTSPEGKLRIDLEDGMREFNFREVGYVF